MTREEAIEVLKNTEDNINYDTKREEIYFTHKWVGAYEMAIAALREQDSNANQHVSNTSNALGGWNSVEDRLPEEAERVLVRLSGDKPPIGEPRLDTDRVVDGRWVRWFDLVTHWMPLPEPPKEEV